MNSVDKASNKGADNFYSAEARLKKLGRRMFVPLLVAIAYVAAAKLGFSLAFTTKQVTAVWPPTGIALAALLLWGYRVWPGIWLGAFASNALTSEPVWTAAAIATGNTLAPVFGNFLLRRFGGFENALERVRDVLLLALFGSAIAMTVSATNGVVELALARIVPWSAFLSVWWVWWAGDAMGVLFVTPLLLTWIGARQKEPAEGGTLELAALSATLLASSSISFLSNFPLRFSVYPFIIWTALRFRQREMTAAIAVVSGLAIWATSHGLGPWASGSLDSRLIQVDSWMSVLAITGLVLGAITAERRTARLDLQELLAQTKRSAVTLQTAFLPEHLPQRRGVRCDVLYIAAEREALIGGDWYDAFDLPDGRVAFSIGDVTGHGLDAAVAAARLRRSIFAAAHETADPAEILTKADQVLGSRHEAPVTALVAILSRDLSTLSYASAGHPPPIVAAPRTAARLLTHGGFPFGIGIPIASETHSVALESDAAILFYTDGLTEFKRDIERTERAVLRAVTRLVDDPHMDRPAVFIQRSVMGSERPADDTVLLVVQLGAALQTSWSYDSSNPLSAQTLRREITHFIRSLAPNEDELFRTELVIGEALANTVEHAPGLVSVDVDWTDAYPVVTVSDTGPGLSPFVAALPADALNENGRGLFLIASLAQDVQIEAQPGAGTRMRIVLPTKRAVEA
jgi:integral membrane sensor domain MASE1/anti-sigma regulatory factor (Ser/Thr protein kinase)